MSINCMGEGSQTYTGGIDGTTVTIFVDLEISREVHVKFRLRVLEGVAVTV